MASCDDTATLFDGPAVISWFRLMSAVTSSPVKAAHASGLASDRRQARRQRAGRSRWPTRWAGPTRSGRSSPSPSGYLGKPRFVPGLHHLDPGRSAPLEPPWPDLLITIGRRPAMAALWVGEQSGGRTKLVLIGRPRRWIERFALVVVPSQFQVPPRGNVVHLALPLMRPDRAAVDTAAESWRARLASAAAPADRRPGRRRDQALPVRRRGRPGPPGRAAGARAARRRHALRHDQPAHAARGGRRRSAPACPPVPSSIAGRRTRSDNPYLGLLGLADRFVVTGDSISMLVEVASLGRPLAIFALPVGRRPLEPCARRAGPHLGDEQARTGRSGASCMPPTGWGCGYAARPGCRAPPALSARPGRAAG